jgi:hypothetical protein
MARNRSGPTMIQRSRQKASEEKALYHQVLGAGRSRVKREFLGLTAEDETKISQRLAQHIGQQFQKGRT